MTLDATLACACAPPRARPSWRQVLAFVDAFACACVPPAWEIAAVAGGPRSSRATRHGSRSERREKPSRPRTAPSRARSTPAGAASRPTPTTSAPGLGSPLPHLRQDWAHPCHICAGTGAHSCHICIAGNGAHTPLHLHRDWGPSPATSAPGLGPIPRHICIAGDQLSQRLNRKGGCASDRGEAYAWL